MLFPYFFSAFLLCIGIFSIYDCIYHLTMRPLCVTKTSFKYVWFSNTPAYQCCTCMWLRYVCDTPGYISKEYLIYVCFFFLISIFLSDTFGLGYGLDTLNRINYIQHYRFLCILNAILNSKQFYSSRVIRRENDGWKRYESQPKEGHSSG